MSEALRAWLSEELERRKWSKRELARQAGVSHAFVNRVLSGDLAPSVNFCRKIALVLGTPPETVLRLAGILPASEDDPALTELQDLVKSLPPSQRKEALRYLRFLLQTSKEE